MLEPDDGWSEDALDALDVTEMKLQVRDFLMSLRRFAAPRT
jgi:hypothetical protein